MSRFVSGGTDEEPTERDEAWLKAQKAVEARYLEKLDAGKQDGGKSLYETLQANKGFCKIRSEWNEHTLIGVV